MVEGITIGCGSLSAIVPTVNKYQLFVFIFGFGFSIGWRSGEKYIEFQPIQALSAMR